MTDQAQIDALRDVPLTPRNLLIDGAFVPSASGETDDVISPLNGAVLTTTAAATAEDTASAIAAARTAFEDKRWRGMPPQMRKKIMLRWADLMDCLLYTSPSPRD